MKPMPTKPQPTEIPPRGLRRPYVLKGPAVVAGVEHQAGDEVLLYADQIERLEAIHAPADKQEG